MFKKQISLLFVVIALAGMLSACSRKPKQETVAPAYSLDEARARAAAQEEPAAPARASAPRASSSYIK